MVRLWSLATGAVWAATFISSVVADSQGSFLWDPPVDNEANVYARVIQLQHAGDDNGKLLATWEHWYTEGPTSQLPNGTQGDFIIRQSDDGGDSWSTLTTVTDPQTGPGHPCARFWQPFFFEFPHQIGKYSEGTILLVGNLVPYNKTFTEFFSWRSTDHGKTWDAVGAWQEGGTTTAGIWEPFLYLDSKGSLVAVFSDERDAANHSQMLVHVVSEDGGDTWGEVVRDVASSTQTDRPGMATVALMDNGEYLMSYEVCGRTNCPIHVKTSTDGITWNATDLGSSVVTDDALYAGSSPYTIWDPSTKQLMLGSHSVWDVCTDRPTPELHRAVFTNKNYGKGSWSWSPSPWYVYNGSQTCNSNYSPNLIPLMDGRILYTAAASEGTTGLCSERTGAAPIAALPYLADFSANKQLGWIDFGGDWSISGDEYVVAPVGNIDARAMTGSSGWTDYEISADVMVSGTSGVVGLNARVTAPSDGLNAFKGYTVAINTFTGNLTLSRESHSMVVLESKAHPGGIMGGQWYHLSLAIMGSKLTASLTSDQDSSKTTYTSTDASFGEGLAGLLANVGGGSFKNVAISSI